MARLSSSAFLAAALLFIVVPAIRCLVPRFCRSDWSTLAIVRSSAWRGEAPAPHNRI